MNVHLDSRVAAGMHDLLDNIMGEVRSPMGTGLVNPTMYAMRTTMKLTFDRAKD